MLLSVLCTLLLYLPPHANRACPEVTFPFRKSDLPLPEMTSVSLRSQLQPHYSALIDRELNRYPQHVLDSLIHNIIVVERLRYDGVSIGGTTVGNVVVLAVGIEEPTPESDEIICSILHAEISSIVFHAVWSSRDDEAWNRLLPENFSFPNNPLEYIRSRNAEEQAPLTDEHCEGFLNDYSRTCLENDFNAYAAALFLGNSFVLTSTDKKVAEKTRIVISIYQRVCLSMDFEYFTNMALRKAGGAEIP